jgi:chromatin remodeling complex protein RSC6
MEVPKKMNKAKRQRYLTHYQGYFKKLQSCIEKKIDECHELMVKLQQTEG